MHYAVLTAFVLYNYQSPVQAPDVLQKRFPSKFAARVDIFGLRLSDVRLRAVKNRDERTIVSGGTHYTWNRPRTCHPLWQKSTRACVSWRVVKVRALTD
ncbi:hypothetical protein Y032_0525g2927 [Ancylostoma ceylanicum]|uniref:Uncharacterized protein n=1 Tax=Ancylostoma ceylanicum TaxID=53326 RepID=A0A016WS28_9BILA|nr:hypothetical protein Y032_0525g2927 [Ancylostoma ceylanicum]